MERRYRLSLVGGPNCGTAILDEVATWPPPRYLFVKGVPGWYAQTYVEDADKAHDFYPDGLSSAYYEWKPK